MLSFTDKDGKETKLTFFEEDMPRIRKMVLEAECISDRRSIDKIEPRLKEVLEERVPLENKLTVLREQLAGELFSQYEMLRYEIDKLNAITMKLQNKVDKLKERVAEREKLMAETEKQQASNNSATLNRAKIIYYDINHF